ncbi:50S ribosomal protein L29 [Mollicutes bacterium LVI A0078]|nr:50S ribosomal protein L29 [Mollicutes bacterium LVI A0075]WOO90266.1 50S ribosomal protein L29 [Mollicutes bacterium LVI A0078]
MQYSDIKEMSTQDIEAKIAENKKELLNLRFQLATGNLEDTAQIKNLKKDIARLMTALNER